ncbi:MAG: RnfH family protein [Betaproteobacteria bacterium]|nr:MAG: RnfH family protein [Betaproteobacteria bacterium]
MSSFRVEVVYALPDRQTILVCEVAEGATVRQSVIASGVLKAHPEIDLDSAEFGIWSERVAQDCLVRDGDRVEIYRPLIADPKLVRRKRAREDRSRRGK